MAVLALYAALHRYSDYATGEGRASRGQLMRTAGIGSERAYYRARRWLIDAGWMTVQDARGGRGRGSAYRLQTTPGSAQVSGANHPRNDTGLDEKPPADVHTHGVQMCTGFGPKPPADVHTTTEGVSRETPPEGWRGVAALLQPKGLTLPPPGHAAIAELDRLEALGWTATEIVAETFEKRGLQLDDSSVDQPDRLLVTRMRCIKRKSPSWLRAEQMAAENAERDRLDDMPPSDPKAEREAAEVRRATRQFLNAKEHA